MDRTVYVIGHKNPDTDSVVAATAYAELKRSLGMPEARAARAGAANPQTEYIFQRFGVHDGKDSVFGFSHQGEGFPKR